MKKVLLLSFLLLIAFLISCSPSSQSVKEEVGPEQVEVPSISEPEIIETTINEEVEAPSECEPESTSEESIIPESSDEEALEPPTEIVEEMKAELVEFAISDVSANEDVRNYEYEIHFLNDITYYTLKITEAKSSTQEYAMVLDEMYNFLQDAFIPGCLDEMGILYVKNLINAVNDLRMVETKRSRLQIIYDYQKSKAISAAMPNPVNIIGSLMMLQTNPVGAIMGLVNTAASSVSMYKSATDELELSNLQNTWELDDKETEILNGCYLTLFEYVQLQASEKGMTLVSGLKIIEPSRMKDFLNHNINRLRYLESNRSIFEEFSQYWIDLASEYYENKQYEKCIEALNEYESRFMKNRPYRYDYRYGSALCSAIDSAIELYGSDIEKCESVVIPMLEKVIANTNSYQVNDSYDWLQFYYCASVYLMFASEDNNFAEIASDLILDNCEFLYSRAETCNLDYLELGYIKKKISDDELKNLSNSQKDDAKKYHKARYAVKDTELPSMDSALLTNIEMLSAIIEKFPNIEISTEFLSPVLKSAQIRHIVLGDTLEIPEVKLSIKGSGKVSIEMPATYADNTTRFALMVRGGDDEWHELYNSSSVNRNVDDLLAFKVNVDRKEKDDINSFVVELTLGKIPSEWKNKAKDYDMVFAFESFGFSFVYSFHDKDLISAYMTNETVF